jgi:predicted RNase H-like nuclease
MDPARPGTVERPACIEVYPHPAMVALFGLDRVIPYKGKSGRSVEFRRAAFADLVRHLEAREPLALGSSARWADIRAAVDHAARQVDLDRLEDEIDAVFCAHLAWLWHHEGDSMTVYGDLATGYIVTPPPPPRPASTPPTSR